MEALLAYVQRTEVCFRLADRLAGFSLVQGVHVEPHPEALGRWIMKRRDPGRTLASWPFDIAPYDVPTDPAFDFDAALAQGIARPPPVLVRVHLCPARAGEDAEAMRREVLGIVETFVGDVPIILEDRARTVAATIRPGDRIVEASPGTNGGFLSDGTDLFGVTCAHVARLGHTVRTQQGKAIGSVVAASTLSPSPAGTLCNPDAPNANQMDAALFEHPGAAPLPSGLTLSDAYGSGQRALMRGAASGGPNSYYFGSLGLTHIVDIEGQPHCFHQLRSIRPVPSFHPWACWPSHRARQGDSGAFITDVGATLLFGMLCAVDGTEGFFLDASRMLAWARGATGRPMLTPY